MFLHHKLITEMKNMAFFLASEQDICIPEGPSHLTGLCLISVHGCKGPTEVMCMHWVVK